MLLLESGMPIPNYVGPIPVAPGSSIAAVDTPPAAEITEEGLPPQQQQEGIQESELPAIDTEIPEAPPETAETGEPAHAQPQGDAPGEDSTMLDNQSGEDSGAVNAQADTNPNPPPARQDDEHQPVDNAEHALQARVQRDQHDTNMSPALEEHKQSQEEPAVAPHAATDVQAQGTGDQSQPDTVMTPVRPEHGTPQQVEHAGTPIRAPEANEGTGTPLNRGESTRASILSPDTIEKITALGNEYLNVGQGLWHSNHNPFSEILDNASDILHATHCFFEEGSAVNLNYETNTAPRGGG